MLAQYVQAVLLAAALAQKGLIRPLELVRAVQTVLGGGAGLATLLQYVAAAGLLLIRTGSMQAAMTAMNVRAGRLGIAPAAGTRDSRWGVVRVAETSST